MSEPSDSAEFLHGFMDHSPFGRQLGLKLGDLGAGRAEVIMPFNETLATYADVVHGGAISTLLDVAASAAAWSGATLTASPRGATVALTVNFLRAARRVDLRARAQVVRRGREICFCDVEVVDPEDRLIAKGLVTYKLS